jgi:hypothetical protein
VYVAAGMIAWRNIKQGMYGSCYIRSQSHRAECNLLSVHGR